MHVFLSYARRDQASIAPLRADFERMGHRVWFDRETAGGQEWWDTVLRNVRGCVVFVFAVSPDSLRSRACQAELQYARALRRPVLPVLVRPVRPGEVITDAPAVDYIHRTPATATALLKAVNGLPAAKQLPVPLPKEPEIPTSYLTTYLDRLTSVELDDAEQGELFAQLHSRLGNQDERTAVWELLVQLRARPELARDVAADVEDVLAPGWQPDPQQRFDARYWDGQSWTSLVWHEGQEFNDRQQPPKLHVHLPARAAAEAEAAKPVHERRTDRIKVVADPAARDGAAPARRRSLPWLVAAGVVVVGGGVAGGFLLLGGDQDTSGATKVARNFVDAVNTHDDAAMQTTVCDKDRAQNAHLYGAFFDSANVTLESVNTGGDQPRFTILANRTTGSTSVRLNIPLAQENGQWRVCDISRALSGR